MVISAIRSKRTVTLLPECNLRSTYIRQGGIRVRRKLERSTRSRLPLTKRKHSVNSQRSARGGSTSASWQPGTPGWPVALVHIKGNGRIRLPEPFPLCVGPVGVGTWSDHARHDSWRWIKNGLATQGGCRRSAPSSILRVSMLVRSAADTGTRQLTTKPWPSGRGGSSRLRRRPRATERLTGRRPSRNAEFRLAPTATPVRLAPPRSGGQPERVRADRRADAVEERRVDRKAVRGQWEKGMGPALG